MKYQEIKNLPTSHPKYKQFLKELEQIELTEKRMDTLEHMNEESKEYFERYIADSRI